MIIVQDFEESWETITSEQIEELLSQIKFLTEEIHRNKKEQNNGNKQKKTSL